MTVRDAFELHRWRLRPFIAAEDTAAAERGSDLWCETIGTGEVATLVWSAAHTPAVTAAYRRFIAQAEGGFAEWEHHVDRFASPMAVDAKLAPPRYRYSALLALFAELAPYVENRRWFCDTGVAWKDEIWLVDGAVYVTRHEVTEPAAYFDALLAEVPGDDALRAYVIDQWDRAASAQLERHATNAILRETLRQDFGEHADQCHELDHAATRFRQLVSAARAIERLRALGADVTAWQARMPEAIAPAEAANIARYDALVAAADSLVREQKYQQALAMIDLAVTAAPAHPDIREHLLRGMALEGMGRTRAAREAFELHIARLATTMPYSLLAHARGLAARGWPASAERMFRALFAAPFFYGTAAYIGAAECRAHAGDSAGARALYAAAIASAARNPGAESERYAARAKYQLAAIDVSVDDA